MIGITIDFMHGRSYQVSIRERQHASIAPGQPLSGRKLRAYTRVAERLQATYTQAPLRDSCSTYFQQPPGSRLAAELPGARCNIRTVSESTGNLYRLKVSPGHAYKHCSPACLPPTTTCTYMVLAAGLPESVELADITYT